jgi:hypothetical protein
MRLRQAVAEESRFSDEELLELINSGYQQACRRAQALPTVAVVTVPAGLVTAPLPNDHAVTLGVFSAGREYTAIPVEHSTRGYRSTYFEYGTTIGVGLGNADTDTNLVLLYARVPVALGMDDNPEWGREWDWLLPRIRWVAVRHGRRRRSDDRKAQQLRATFDLGIRDLRRQTALGPIADAGAQRKRTIFEMKGSPLPVDLEYPLLIGRDGLRPARLAGRSADLRARRFDQLAYRRERALVKRLGYQSWANSDQMVAVPLAVGAFSPASGAIALIFYCNDGKRSTRAPATEPSTQIPGATGFSTSAPPTFTMFNDKDLLVERRRFGAVVGRYHADRDRLRRPRAVPRGVAKPAVGVGRLRHAHRVFWSDIGNPASWNALNFVDIHSPGHGAT